MGEKEGNVGQAISGDYRDPEPFEINAQGQALKFYISGDARLKALVDLIDTATSSLDLCYYMYVDDRAGLSVRKALTAAAKRGVRVRLITDAFGSDTGPGFFDPLTAAGGEHFRFTQKWTRRYLIRNHQKMAIADRQTALIGGFNVERDYFASAADNGWHDLGLVITGSAVDDLVRWYDELMDWVSRPKAQFRALRAKLRDWDSGSGPVRLLIGGPTTGLSSWAQCASDDLERGTRLDMVMAYFSPSRRMMHKIGQVAEHGQTRLLMAGKSDNGATIGATRSLYHYLFGKGAKIWEFRACKLHMKLLVVDNAVYVGSANFDVRSLYINLELMLRIEDAALAARIRQFITEQLAASDRITQQKHKQHATIWNRLRWNLSWLVVNVLDYTISRRLNFGL